MHRKHIFALAASVAVIAIGAPLAWQVAQTPRHETGGSLSGRAAQQVAKPEVDKQQAVSKSGAETQPAPASKIATIDQAREHEPAREAAEAKVKALDEASRQAEGRRREEILERAAEQAATSGRKGNRVVPPADADRLSALLDKVPEPTAPPSPQATAPAPRNAIVRAPTPPVVAAAPRPDGNAQPRRALGPDIGQRQALIGEQSRRQPGVPGMVVGNLDQLHQPPVVEGRDRFPEAAQNPVKRVAEEPVSTFSVDVDTASYSFVRRALNAGRLPPKDAVRIEEMINYFPYGYPMPESREQPFLPTVTVVPSPWNPGRQIVHIALKGYALKAAERPRSNLVFLVDTSGSMGPEDRLPLVRNALRLLVDELKPDDTIGIVTYAGNAAAALPPTRVAEKARILAEIEKLRAGGSTAGAAGLQQAYAMAEAGFDKAAVNRIVLATDGDFNVGITDRGELKSFIERKRQTGVYLSILGVGIGNHNDRLMQTLAQAGNGVAAYIDTLAEARKVLVEEASSTLFPIARDVKIQVEFNPAAVTEYRLVGYETRVLRREDFNNDRVDAGDVGSGHTVTALYEIAPAGVPATVDGLRYAQPAEKTAAPAPTPAGRAGELGYLKLRYKLPGEDKSRLIELAITHGHMRADVVAAPADVRFAIAVAGFGELLKGSPHTSTFAYDDVIALASGTRGDDPFGYRSEFLSLVRLAKSARP